MSRKTIYWGIGIAAAIILVVVVYAVNNHDHSVSEPGNIAGADTAEDAGYNHAADKGETPGLQSTGEIPSESVENTELAAYIKEQDQIMFDMMNDMESIGRTQNASFDFINGMIPHHESAVAMSESLLKYGGENPEVRKLAEDIIEAQNTEVEELKSLAKQLSDEAGNEKGEAYLDEYDRMFSGSHAHHMDLSQAKSVDEAFAKGMVEHHQMAVDMAKSILNYTESEQLREMAQNMIDVQEKEIEQLQAIIKRI